MILRFFFILSLTHATASSLLGELVYITTAATETIGGITIRNGDIAKYDNVTDTATLIFNEDLFSADEIVDAFQLLPNGNLLLSTANAATLGGLTFGNADVVEYDPVSDLATIFFDENLFAAGENIDAFHLLSDGTAPLSTAGPATLGGLTFADGDVARYDFASDTATLFFDEDLFSGSEDIDAIHLMNETTLRLSTVGNATLGGLAFADGDVVSYDIGSDTATLVFSESLFANGAEINGLFVPESAAGMLCVFALLDIPAAAKCPLGMSHNASETHFPEDSEASIANPKSRLFEIARTKRICGREPVRR